MAVTVVISGIPHYVTLNDFALNLDKLFDTDDIGTFRVRDMPNHRRTGKRQIGLDFKTGFDAMSAQQLLDGYKYTLPDGMQKALKAKVNQKKTTLGSPRFETEASTSKANAALVPYSSNTLQVQQNDIWRYATLALDSKLEYIKKQNLVMEHEMDLLKKQRKIQKKLKKLEKKSTSDDSSSSSDSEARSRKKKKSKKRHKKKSKSKRSVSSYADARVTPDTSSPGFGMPRARLKKLTAKEYLERSSLVSHSPRKSYWQSETDSEHAHGHSKRRRSHVKERAYGDSRERSYSRQPRSRERSDVGHYRYAVKVLSKYRTRSRDRSREGSRRTEPYWSPEHRMSSRPYHRSLPRTPSPPRHLFHQESPDECDDSSPSPPRQIITDSEIAEKVKEVSEIVMEDVNSEMDTLNPSAMNRFIIQREYTEIIKNRLAQIYDYKHMAVGRIIDIYRWMHPATDDRENVRMLWKEAVECENHMVPKLGSWEAVKVENANEQLWCALEKVLQDIQLDTFQPDGQECDENSPPNVLIDLTKKTPRKLRQVEKVAGLPPIIAEHPKFFLPVRKITREMKCTLNFSMVENNNKFCVILRRVVRQKVRAMLKNDGIFGRNYMDTRAIVALYRQHYPRENDAEFVESVANDVINGVYNDINNSDDEYELDVKCEPKDELMDEIPDTLKIKPEPLKVPDDSSDAIQKIKPEPIEIIDDTLHAIQNVKSEANFDDAYSPSTVIIIEDSDSNIEEHRWRSRDKGFGPFVATTPPLPASEHIVSIKLEPAAALKTEDSSVKMEVGPDVEESIESIGNFVALVSEVFEVDE